MSFKKNKYDLVMCNSVLEHLEDPNKAINRLKKISSKYVIVSVPYEPLFSLANLVRFKYIKTCGNYPSHMHRWNKTSFRKLLKKHFRSVKIKTESVVFLFMVIPPIHP